jgi:hypothetical protein
MIRSDTPGTYAGQVGRTVVVNAGITEWPSICGRTTAWLPGPPTIASRFFKQASQLARL